MLTICCVINGKFLSSLMKFLHVNFVDIDREIFGTVFNKQTQQGKVTLTYQSFHSQI